MSSSRAPGRPSSPPQASTDPGAPSPLRRATSMASGAAACAAVGRLVAPTGSTPGWTICDPAVGCVSHHAAAASAIPDRSSSTDHDLTGANTQGATVRRRSRTDPPCTAIGGTEFGEHRIVGTRVIDGHAIRILTVDDVVPSARAFHPVAHLDALAHDPCRPARGAVAITSGARRREHGVVAGHGPAVPRIGRRYPSGLSSGPYRSASIAARCAGIQRSRCARAPASIRAEAPAGNPAPTG